MALVAVERVPVRLVPDGETGHVLPVAAPDVPGGPGMDRGQVIDSPGPGIEQAQRVNDPCPGGGGEGEQVVDPGEAVAAQARGDEFIHRAPADPQVAQAEVAQQGDQRLVGRAEQVARHPGVAGVERPPFETQPGEIARDHRAGMPSVDRDRYGMGARGGHVLMVGTRRGAYGCLVGGLHGGAAGPMVGRDRELARIAALLDDAFRALGMTDAASATEMTGYDADEFYVR